MGTLCDLTEQPGLTPRNGVLSVGTPCDLTEQPGLMPGNGALSTGTPRNLSRHLTVFTRAKARLPSGKCVKRTLVPFTQPTEGKAGAGQLYPAVGGSALEQRARLGSLSIAPSTGFRTYKLYQPQHTTQMARVMTTSMTNFHLHCILEKQPIVVFLVCLNFTRCKISGFYDGSNSVAH